jgi:hypothetical protein
MEGTLIVSIPVTEFIAYIEQTVRKVLTEKPVQQDKPLTSKEVMKLCNISTSTLQKWRNSGKIPFTQIDNKIFYSKDEVLSTIKNVSHSTIQN